MLKLSHKTVAKLFAHFPALRGGGGGGTWVIFAGNVLLSSQSPYPIIVYSVANYRPILVTFGQI